MKNPDKMSKRELRLEVQTLRVLNKELREQLDNQRTISHRLSLGSENLSERLAEAESECERSSLANYFEAEAVAESLTAEELLDHIKILLRLR